MSEASLLSAGVICGEPMTTRARSMAVLPQAYGGSAGTLL